MPVHEHGNERKLTSKHAVCRTRAWNPRARIVARSPSTLWGRGVFPICTVCVTRRMRVRVHARIVLCKAASRDNTVFHAADRLFLFRVMIICDCNCLPRCISCDRCPLWSRSCRAIHSVRNDLISPLARLAEVFRFDAYVPRFKRALCELRLRDFDCAARHFSGSIGYRRYLILINRLRNRARS